MTAATVADLTLSMAPSETSLPSSAPLPTHSACHFQRLITDVAAGSISLEQAEQILFLRQLLACGHRIYKLSSDY